MMPSGDSLPHKILALWRRLPALRRRQFILLVGLMVIASFAEVASVAALLPFLSVLTAPERVFNYPAVQPIIQLLMIRDQQQLLLAVTVVFCAAVLLAGGIRLLLVYAMVRYSFAVGADLSLDVYRRTLYQPYKVHISRNSSEIIDGVLGKTATAIGYVLVPMLKLFSSMILLIGIASTLLIIDPVTMLLASLVFGGIYWAILRVTRHSLRANSERIADNSRRLVRSMQEGLGGIRDILIDGSQEVFCWTFQHADRSVRLAQGYNNFVSEKSPLRCRDAGRPFDCRHRLCDEQSRGRTDCCNSRPGRARARGAAAAPHHPAVLRGAGDDQRLGGVLARHAGVDGPAAA